jgi:hypothetical protein
VDNKWHQMIELFSNLQYCIQICQKALPLWVSKENKTSVQAGNKVFQANPLKNYQNLNQNYRHNLQKATS